MPIYIHNKDVFDKCVNKIVIISIGLEDNKTTYIINLSDVRAVIFKKIGDKYTLKLFDINNKILCGYECISKDTVYKDYEKFLELFTTSAKVE